MGGGCAPRCGPCGRPRLRSSDAMSQLSAKTKRRLRLFAGIATLAASLGLTRLEPEGSMSMWIPDDAPARRSYTRLLDRFGGDETAVLAVFAPDVFAPATL